MRYLSLFLPHLPTDRLVRLGLLPPPAQEPQKSIPCATYARSQSALRLDSLDPRGKSLGLEPGLALADARARYPSLAVAPSDPVAQARVLADIRDWCRRFTPLAALDAPDGVLLDVTGATHLFGGEEKLLDEIVRRLRKQGFHARAALAETPEAAWALAHYAERTLLPEGLDEKDLVRRIGLLPLAALRLDADCVAGLGRAGLRNIRDLLLRPRAPIAARFGAMVFTRLDALLGRTKSAIAPQFEAPFYVAERRFSEGLVTQPDIDATLASLARDLAAMLESHEEGARHMEVSFFRVDGAVRHLDVRTSRPLRDPAAIARLFRERIEALGEEGLEADYGFDVIRLAALSVDRQKLQQLSLDQSRNAAGDLAGLIDRLGARLGEDKVKRLVAQDRHRPERASLCLPATSRLSVKPQVQQPDEEREPQFYRQALSLRPLRLLLRPEPIETVAAVPDGPPLRFRWRRVLHEVLAVEGPERIADDWWKEHEVLTRDYFRAATVQGQSFWLYREGLYRAADEPRWFMHGLFA